MVHAQTIAFEELDDATQTYLRTARDGGGLDMPGVFVRKSNYLPVIGLIVGLIIMGVTLFFTLPPGPLDDPTNTAMLQTAGLLVGGWMVIAAFRVWGSAKSPRTIGHFVYADPQRLYNASGDTVTITDLSGLKEANATQNYNEGKYQNTAIRLTFDGGRQNVTVHDEEGGRQLTVFLNRVVSLKGPEAGALRDLQPALAGGLAREEARTGAMPRQLSERDLAVSQLPEPQKANRASSGMLAYLIIIAVAVGGVFGLREVNATMRDDHVFELVKNDGPPHLRAYLVDPRNTNHRQEVEQKLAAFYAVPINVFKQQADAGNPIAKGPLEVLERIKTAPQPVVSIRVKEERDPSRKSEAFAEARVREREEAVQKEIVDVLTKIVGPDKIAFAQVDGVPPMIGVNYKYVPAERNSYAVEWSASFRRGPDDPEAAAKTWPPVHAGDDGVALKKAAVDGAQQMLREAAGETAARAMAPPQKPQGVPGFPN